MLICCLGYKDDITEAQLTEAGVKNKDDIMLILQAFHHYKKLYVSDSSKVLPTAPAETTATAPPDSPEYFTRTESECVICMDSEVCFFLTSLIYIIKMYLVVNYKFMSIHCK